MKYIFGPVASRRFGSSLGIDLSPEQKCCNYDCLYCELKKAKVIDNITNPPQICDILDELNLALKEHTNIDVITITANGEPSLYEDLGELICEINKIKTTQKTLILSNGSAVLYEQRMANLMKFDIVKFSLDSAIQKTFRKIDRSIKNYNIDEMIEKMAKFRAKFSGELVMEVLVIEGFNDNEDEFKALNLAFSKIKPHRIDISSIDRPPAHEVKSVSFEKLQNLASLITAAPVAIASKKALKNQINLTKFELIKLLKLRPQSEFDVQNNFSASTKEILQNLIDEKIAVKSNLAGISFYLI